MKLESQILATLLGQSRMKRSKKISVSVNQFGQLPTVLINPRSTTGHIIPGIWLGDPQDFTADGTAYRLVTGTSSSAQPTEPTPCAVRKTQPETVKHGESPPRHSAAPAVCCGHERMCAVFLRREPAPCQGAGPT